MPLNQAPAVRSARWRRRDIACHRCEVAPLAPVAGHISEGGRRHATGSDESGSMNCSRDPLRGTALGRGGVQFRGVVQCV